MRFWLTAFVLIFAAVELFQWFAGLASWEPGGVWLVLGGMGLAVLSNAGQLKAGQVADAQRDSIVPEADATPAAAPEKRAEKSTDKFADKDSISFKVRPLKR